MASSHFPESSVVSWHTSGPCVELQLPGAHLNSSSLICVISVPKASPHEALVTLMSQSTSQLRATEWTMLATQDVSLTSTAPYLSWGCWSSKSLLTWDTGLGLRIRHRTEGTQVREGTKVTLTLFGEQKAIAFTMLQLLAVNLAWLRMPISLPSAGHPGCRRVLSSAPASD